MYQNGEKRRERKKHVKDDGVNTKDLGGVLVVYNCPVVLVYCLHYLKQEKRHGTHATNCKRRYCQFTVSLQMALNVIIHHL